MILVIKLLVDHDLGNHFDADQNKTPPFFCCCTEPLVRHPDFRLFACMNPATDVGKRNLPLGIRNRWEQERTRPGVGLKCL